MKKKVSKNSPEKKDFLVVGLGASAGGVKALQDFFATMPPNSGMAFVVILHLDPHHESNLANILQAQTQMPVVQVNETLKVERNHVYVIPPNNQLEMVDGVVRCKTAAKEPGSRVAIDVFFRTLAAAYERNGVCVILSGTGSDGTLGLKRVKEANGFAVVQDPAEAEYDGMPRSAIATGLVDWVLPVSQMPEKLINFKASSERLHLTDDDPQKIADEINAEESLREILAILRVRTGHDFSDYKKPTLVRRIARHLQIHELEDIPTYLKFLRDNPDEIASLQRNLLINVTNFFRDKQAFNALETEVIPRLFEGKTARDTVRVWSAGCASGEEAYSLAILVHEYAARLRETPKIQIFATDVDEEAIAEARENSYPHSIEADVSPERLKRYFVTEGNRYRVKKEIRESVLFAPHNILRDPPFSKLDLIVCRNLLIYLNRESQDRVMGIFHFALASGGYLFLGSSESIDSDGNLFAPVDKKYRIFSRRPAQAQPVLAAPFVGRWQTQLLENRNKERDRAGSLAESHYKLLEKYSPPSILVNQDFNVIYMSESVGRYLRFSGGEPTQNVLKLVHTDLLPDLRAALFAAQREDKSSVLPNVRVVIDGEETLLNLFVRPVDLTGNGENSILVVFNEQGETIPAFITGENDKSLLAGKSADSSEALIVRLEDELERTKTQLRSSIEEHEITIEELKASNEELQAINEELRSAGEELETSKEELQSVNEELTTVNHELKEKIDETTHVNSDLQNLMAATDIATIFLDRNFRIKRYTPPAERLFSITPADIGRPLEHFTHRLDYDRLTKDAEEVLRSLKPIEVEISDTDNRHYLTHFLPYRTEDDRIGGVVLNFVDITRRKRQEEETIRLAARLEQQTKLFDTTLTNISDFAYIFDCDGRFVYSNKPLLDLLGITLEEITGKNFFDLGYPPELAARHQTEIEQVIRTGKPIKAETAFTNPEGKQGFYEYIFSPVFAADGETVESVVGSTRDSTERKQFENALHKSREHLLTALQAGKIFSWELNLETQEFSYSENIADVLGFRLPAQIIQNPFESFMHPEDAEGAVQATLHAVETGETYLQDIRFVNPHTGEIIWMRSQGEITTDADGRKVFAGVARNITGEIRAEEARRETEVRLQLVMESVKDYAILTTDRQGIITDWNAGAEKIFGWTAEEAVGQFDAIIFTPEDRKAGIPEAEMQTALEKGHAEDERWHVRKDGSRFYVSGILSPLKDGDFDGFVKVCRDQTDKMRVEKALQEKETLRRLVIGQEDERRRIARDIHDHLGQQLTALRLKLDNARKSCGDEKVSEQIDEAQKVAVQLDADVDFIAWELRPAALDDLGLLATLKNFVREWSHHTGVKAEFQALGLGKKRFDYEVETNIYRIAQEALNNIYKHSKAKNTSVLLEKRDDKIVLIVEDDGQGFNVNDKKNRRKGIGLTGMEERAKILGGELEIESTPKVGTTVYTRVPLVKKRKKE